MKINISIYILLLFLTSCHSRPDKYENLDMYPPIIPDYIDVIIPQNIAPLNFYLDDYAERIEVKFKLQGKELYTYYGKYTTDLPLKKWKTLLEKALKQDSVLQVEVAKLFRGKWLKFNPFTIKVAEPIDPYIAYRLIEPGYESWNIMGIYQRNLTNFQETPIMVNTLTDKNCMNCHSFSNYRPDRFVFHMRGKLGGTMLLADGKLTRLDTKTRETISSFTYPQWHPSGKYIAFSTNITAQFFHATKEKQIEVYDLNSDIVLYDVEKNLVIKDSVLASSRRFETYPTWSPDGQTLYFCRADSVSMPQEYRDAKYMICSIKFDTVNARFEAKVDTVYQHRGSCAFPRVSPDGRFLLFTTMNYGCFPIWHKEADLYMMDLTRKEPVENHANSAQTDSYHSWSSNGRWVMFSSRRQDGLFTRLYFSYTDQKGKMHKPFLLPQTYFEPGNPLLKSYNVPEFIRDKVSIYPYRIEKEARKEATPVKI